MFHVDLHHKNEVKCFSILNEGVTILAVGWEN